MRHEVAPMQNAEVMVLRRRCMAFEVTCHFKLLFPEKLCSVDQHLNGTFNFSGETKPIQGEVQGNSTLQLQCSAPIHQSGEGRS